MTDQTVTHQTAASAPADNGAPANLPIVREPIHGEIVERVEDTIYPIRYGWAVPVEDRASVEGALRTRKWQKLTEAAGRTLRVDRYAYWQEWVPHPETGEYQRLFKVVILGPDGGFECHSAQPFRAMAGALKDRGPGPWTPPIEVQVVMVRTRRGFQALSLVLPCPDDKLGIPG